MIDFRLDEEQQMLSDSVSRFAEERIRKIFREAEEAGQMPADIVKAGWEIGLLPTGLPEAYGGFGEYSAVTGAIAVEAFAWGDFAATLNILQPNLVAMPLMLCGTDEQKEQYLPLFCHQSILRCTGWRQEPGIEAAVRRIVTLISAHFAVLDPRGPIGCTAPG